MGISVFFPQSKMGFTEQDSEGKVLVRVQVPVG